MPVDRRDVLFSFSEMNALLPRVAGKYTAHFPPALSALNILEVMHTSDVATSFHDKRTRMLTLLKRPAEGDGAIFRARRPAAIIGEVIFGFFVPDSAMMEILLAECTALNIALPRRATKLIIAEDLNMGLRCTIDDNGLAFETP